MYPFVKTSKNTQNNIYKGYFIVYTVAVLIWFLLMGFQLYYSCFIVDVNTSILLEDTTKIKVVNISTDGKVYLDDTSNLNNDDIKEYINIKPKSGTWYLPDNKSLAVEVLEEKGKALDNIFLIAYWMCFPAFLYLFYRYKLGFKSLIVALTFILYELIYFIIIDYYCNVICINNLYMWISLGIQIVSVFLLRVVLRFCSVTS